MTYEAGDLVTLTCLVEGAAGDTSAAVVVTHPDGTTSSPATTPNGDRTEWAALLDVPVAGIYTPVWTVTGTAEGVAWDETVLVAAPPTAAPTGGRVYATTTDYATETAPDAPPAGLLRTLRAASRRVDRILLHSHYATDDDGYPTDADVIVALRDMTVAQAIHMRETGDPYGLGTAAQWDSVSAGRITLTRRAGSGASAVGGYAPAAIEVAQQAGLIGGGPSGYGGYR